MEESSNITSTIMDNINIHLGKPCESVQRVTSAQSLMNMYTLSVEKATRMKNLEQI